MTTKKTFKNTTIIIGAGASADFCPKNLKEGQDNPIKMPMGEDLVKEMMNFRSEIPKLFLRKYLEDELQIHQNEYRNLFSKHDKVSKKLYDDILKRKENNKPCITLRKGYPNPLFHEIDYKNSIGFSDSQLQKLDEEIQNFISTIFNTLYNPHDDSINLENLPNLLIEKLNLHHYVDLGTLLHFYDPVSIDFFLSSIQSSTINTNIAGVTSKKEDLITAGKELIAYYLLKAEVKNSFDANNKIWYRWLRNEIVRLGKTPEEINTVIKDKINIISFNYDRSLDEYLKTKLPEYYDVIKSKIIYPYGSLTCFDNIEYGDLKSHSIANLFVKNDFRKKVNDKENGIFTIDDERTSFKERAQEAHEIIKNSEKLYFFGFAFLQENLNFLGLQEGSIKPHTKVFYTNYNQSKKVKNAFEKLLFIHRVREPITDRLIISSALGVYDAITSDFDLNFE